ncbi:probable tRNA pseudouridine synthase 1 isoform X1 [Hypomesus transpacificus]|uniref:probable tRNA pseudouridine synthase 1 isoform X1 n=1 Tax=Hypomesus transpacificus TaxID=137520 RepID=UPI001F07F3C0|nr:probable tRNA pseudouridine synthase 1 isoform X1 [Hypomesus transpacificus]
MAGIVTNGSVPKHASLSTLQSLNGLFAIYKKEGPTSADVLNSLKEALLKEAGVKNPNPRKRKKQDLKIGHGGTLDSAASGVLVVGIGNGTKMLSTMLAGSKKYRAVGELGKATDTLDATGSVVHQEKYDHITQELLQDKLKIFTGDIMQVPPLSGQAEDMDGSLTSDLWGSSSYSALKKDGKRLSVLLKQGHEVEAKPARPVTVHNISLLDFQPPVFTLDIESGGGFYVRSLVDDLGKALASCAHVKELVRTKQGQFTLDLCLREEQWTLQHLLQSLQPCPGSGVNGETVNLSTPVPILGVEAGPDQRGDL